MTTCIVSSAVQYCYCLVIMECGLYIYRNRGPSMDTKEFTVLVKNSINFPKLSPHFRL